MSESGKLRELASWYREYAERTENPVIWDSRIRTAEDLEAEADRLDDGFGGRRPDNDVADAPLAYSL
jgi:hypothetical protein